MPVSDCLAFEDSRNGVLSARGAGLNVLVAPSAYTAGDDFGGAAWTVPDLTLDNLPVFLARAVGAMV